MPARARKQQRPAARVPYTKDGGSLTRMKLSDSELIGLSVRRSTGMESHRFLTSDDDVRRLLVGQTQYVVIREGVLNDRTTNEVVLLRKQHEKSWTKPEIKAMCCIDSRSGLAA